MYKDSSHIVRRIRSKVRTISLFFLATLIFMPGCLPTQEEVILEPYGEFTYQEIDESSGLVKSRQYENVFWTHNDHGDFARIFATTAEGELIGEVRISGAKNIDWEDIAADDAGFLYIGDFGNNRKNQKELAIYMIREPNPYQSDFAPVLKRVPFDLPDHKNFATSKDKKIDCEALFWANGHLYCLTKNHYDKVTKLYRFAPLQDNKHQTLTKIAEFEIDGAVTSADASMDGKKLLVLCYQYIYLFEKPTDDDNYLAGQYKRILFRGRKSEGICFAGSDIFFSNEQREIYKLPQSIFEEQYAFSPELAK